MCGCTLYDSPTCGHSWISMSQPCGYLQDLLNCPYRQTYQTLIAPPYACPTCHGGFADRETIEMVQGPWGCNQLIRSHAGGNYAIPGQWGHAPIMPGGWRGSALTSGAMVPMHNYGYDHRIGGPYSPRSHMIDDTAAFSMMDSCMMVALTIEGREGNTRALDITSIATRASLQQTVASCRTPESESWRWL
jgi:hypothetical protein